MRSPTALVTRQSVTTSRWARLAGAAAVVVALLALYITFGNARLGGDHYASALTAWAIATTGSADVSPFAEAYEPLWLFAVDDQVLANRFAGSVLYAVPFYAVAGALGLPFSMWPGIVAASACATASVVMMWAALLPMGRRVALGGAAVLGLGTATFAVSADTQWSHAPAQAALAGAVLALTRGRLGWAGVALGLGVAARPHAAVAAAAIGVWMAVAARSWVPAARIGAGALPGVLVLLTYNGLVHGRFWPTNGLERAADDVSWGGSGGGVGLAALPENLLGTLASPGRGVLVLYPVLVLLVFWLPAAWRRASTAERAAAVGGLAYLFAQLSLNRYSGGWWFFGSRLTIEPLTLAFPLLVRAFTAVPSGGWRVTAWLLLGWGSITHVLGAVSVQPEVEGDVLNDPWTFYDPWVVATMRGWEVTALVLGLSAAAFALGSWALATWRRPQVRQDEREHVHGP